VTDGPLPPDPPDAEALVLPVTSVAAAVRYLRGDGVSVRSEGRTGGGSINDTRRLVLSDGDSLFLKINGTEHSGLFLEEARGLMTLRRADAGPRVPEALAIFEDGRRQYLLMEHIEPGRRSGKFAVELGARLAEMHRSQRSPSCGFGRDNHIGATPQPNGWVQGWYDFFGERRLLYQVELAARNGRADRRMREGVELLVRRLPDLLPNVDDGQASILHGDLWGGNVMAASTGEAAIIDPAVSYGHREADLAMTSLFGGFEPAFYRAYAEAWPLVPGYEARRDIYNLYHLLNHLNLFGDSYRPGCTAIIERFR
jgi:protein-ribulosamine 3-kinase